MSQPKLPDDLFFDILSRLPVQSLLRFKCVCKSWLSVITQPHFIKAHLLKSTRSLYCPRQLLPFKPFYSSEPLSFFSFDFEAPKSPTKHLQCPRNFSEYSYLRPLCSCDGLILLLAYDDARLVGSKTLFLWNPSIRSYKRIICPYKLPFHWTGNYGLFYDSIADDYRVLVVSKENETSVLVVAVYSLRNDFWDTFIDDRYGLWVSEYQEVQAVVNGVVHWVMESRELCLCVIAYFDLVEGKFKEVPSPSFWNKHNGMGMNLVVLGEFLCVSCDIGMEQLEVYAMMEYGKKDSWTRLFVMPAGAIERNLNISKISDVPKKKKKHISTNYVRPLCLTKKGQIVVSVWFMGIGLYDPKDSAFSWYDCCRGQMAIPYVETLVSLVGGNIQSKETGRAGNSFNLSV